MSARTPNPPANNDWLKPYYLSRAVFSLLWLIAAVTLGVREPLAAALLLVAYPAWDASANFVDAKRNGGLRRNMSQMLNVVISSVAAVGVAIALETGMNAVLGVFGVWAFLAGIFQLATGVRRWGTNGAQWAMVLSGGQSALAGTLFLKVASSRQTHGIVELVPYVAFGAFYFFVSAIWLMVLDARRKTSTSKL